MSDTIYYKIADRPEEFDQIHALNYQTFVEEIPQHEGNDQKKLIDKFHDKNIYAIAIQRNHLVGMIAFNDERPFSLDSKVENLEQYIPKHQSMIEVRLLSINPKKRGGVILVKLIQQIYYWTKSQKTKYDYVLISGTTRQLTLYKKMGFVPFYHLVGKADAQYQPMYLNIQQFISTNGDKL